MSKDATRPDPRRSASSRARSVAAGGLPKLELIAPAPSTEEAAAIVAALERFMRATAPPSPATSSGSDLWRRAAILEGVTREDDRGSSDPWINT
jgi:hypothetical protein